MAPNYTVTAPLVVVPDQSGSDRYLYKGAAVPADIDQEHIDRLAGDKLIEKTKDSPAASTEAGKEPTVNEVLADVGDDPEKARAALEAEQAKGDKARSTLVEKLEAIANPAS